MLGAPDRVEAQTENDFAIWVGFFGAARVFKEAPSPVFWLDVHARQSEGNTVHILRPGLGYQFTKWGSIWVGYAWVPVWAEATGTRVDEQRVWEQLIFDYHPRSSLSMQSRTRFEQRFSEAGNGVGYRFRQLVRINVMPWESVRVGFSVWDEVFVGMGNANWTKKGFDQNRVFGGIGVNAINTAEGFFRVEAGYQNVYLVRGSFKRISHVLAVNLFAAFKGKR